MKLRVSMFTMITLFCLGFCGSMLSAGETVKTALEGMINPDGIYADKTQVYVTDGAAIHIFSREGIKPVMSFGKKGEGPGEFMKHQQQPLRVDVGTGRITVNCLGKMSLFTKKGEYIKEIKTPYRFGGYLPVGEDKYAGWQNRTEDDGIVNAINILDAKFKILHELVSRKNPVRRDRSIEMFRSASLRRVYGKRVFVAIQKEFIIEAFDENGKNIFTIAPQYRLIKVTEERKQGTLDYFRTDPKFRALYTRFKDRIRFPEFLPALRDFEIDGNKLYARTYHRENGRDEFYVFDIDKQGKLLKKCLLPVRHKDAMEAYPYTIENNVLYQVVETPDEEWELHITQL